MPINIYWNATDATVIHIDIIGRYTWAEFDERIQLLAALVSRADYRVVEIFDITRAAPMPPEAPLEHLQKAIDGAPSNVDLSVVAGLGDRFVRIIWNKATANRRDL